ncbi:uracil phosphoribosyltransferase [Burkholderia gladioli]|uniref:uracil phosphoribosyltransferase n=1 Tax=Burkholderia gladioli TaxID=28095 RepID=UPI003132CA56
METGLSRCRSGRRHSLATVIRRIQMLLDKGVPEDRIIFVAFIASPEGIQVVCERHPGIRIVTSSIERRLNENAYMLPGIGDFGDRFFGTHA